MIFRFCVSLVLIASFTIASAAQTCPMCDEFVTAHNNVRANGPFGPGNPAPNPPLSPLTWSTPLATMANNWASGCVYGHNPNRGFIGENIYWQTGSVPTPTTAVNWWGPREAPFYDWNSNMCTGGQDCLHYTQIVWSTTTEVGCAIHTCPAGVGTPPPGVTGQWHFVVCDYSPPGNIVGQRPYEVASTATLSGRVLQFSGRGITHARITISGGGLPAPQTVLTGRLGGFSFANLPTGNTYTVTVSQRRFTFAQPSRNVTLAGNVSNFDFVANP